MTQSNITWDDILPEQSGLDEFAGLVQKFLSTTIKEENMATIDGVPYVYAGGGIVEGGRVDALTVADIWAAFPNLEILKLDDGYTPQEVAEAQRQFAADVRVAAKRNREDVAYERIRELQ